jgi:hypothetical protein
VASITYAAAMTASQPVWKAYWRSLLAGIAPGVAAATLIQGLLTASAGKVQLDGAYVVLDGAWQRYAVAAIWLVAWTLSLSAAILVLGGAFIDAPLRAAFALRTATRRLGWAVAVIVVQGVFTALLLVLVGWFAVLLGPFGLVLVFFAVFIPSATITALPIVVLDGTPTAPAISRAWELTAGKRWRTFWLCAAVLVPGAVVVWAAERIGQWSAGPVTALLLHFLVAAATVIAIGFQASLLTRWRLRQDAPGVIRPHSSPRPDRWRLGAALITAAVLADGAVALANPFGVPVLDSSQHSLGDLSSPAAITADGRFVLAKGNAAPLVWADGGAVLPDGRTLFASHDNSGPTVHFEICGRESFCDTKLVSTFDKPGLSWLDSVAVAVGDGLVVVAVVQQSGMQADQAELVVWRCPTIACATAERHVVPHYFRSGDALYPDFLLAAGKDAAGRLVIASAQEDTNQAWVVRCADDACVGNTHEQANMAVLVGNAWPTLAGLGFDGQGRLMGALAGPRDPGPAADIVTEDPAVVTVTCRDDRCEQRDVRRWHQLDPKHWHAGIQPVALADGSLILVDHERYDNVTSVIQCESHCG